MSQTCMMLIAGTDTIAIMFEPVTRLAGVKGLLGKKHQMGDLPRNVKKGTTIEYSSTRWDCVGWGPSLSNSSRSSTMGPLPTKPASMVRQCEAEIQQLPRLVYGSFSHGTVAENRQTLNVTLNVVH